MSNFSIFIKKYFVKEFVIG